MQDLYRELEIVDFVILRDRWYCSRVIPCYLVSDNDCLEGVGGSPGCGDPASEGDILPGCDDGVLGPEGLGSHHGLSNIPLQPFPDKDPKLVNPGVEISLKPTQLGILNSFINSDTTLCFFK